MSKENYRLADSVADYFIAAVDFDAGDLLSHLKLQKLCYLAQGFHIARHGTALFDSEIQAWAHGPVVVDLYKRFKHYKWNPIGLEARKTDPHETLSKEALALLRDIWVAYGQFSAKQLENITHKHSAWRNAYGERPIGAACDEVISQEALESCFKEMISNA